jgi:predicted ATP-dependent endonuclease of OLD family
MRLTKFRITQYKSIEDSGYCYVASDLTILAGKNESGKTAILEAIRSFDCKHEVPTDAHPLNDSGEPTIEMIFDVDDKTLNEIQNEAGISINKKLRAYFAENGLVIIKNAKDEYLLSNEIYDYLDQQIHFEATTEADSEHTEHFMFKFQETVLSYAPNFVFFSDFSDILPFEIPLQQAQKNEIVRDFAKVAGIDLERVIAATDKQRRRNLLRGRSAKLSGNFMNYWGQDELSLISETDGGNLLLGIEEKGKTHFFKVEQRSKGLQWFLSFYLRLNAQQKTTNIILIDEPGLYLHPKAQKDVLKVLQNISNNSQVIFSTHSPYLIDPNRLDRIRLVLKDKDKGTKIENKIHKTADKETLTPIVTAIGLDINNDFSIAGKNNVLVEGISDYYYLQGLIVYKKLDSKFNLIPSVGASKIPTLASLLIGWDLRFVAVLDNDTQGKQAGKKLSEMLYVENKNIIYVSNNNNFCIEDIFSNSDFNKYILEDKKNNSSDITNSKFLKKQNLDKVLLAKKFFEKINDNHSQVSLSTKTVNGFDSIFKKIEEALEL